jgi:hypothetical protein
MRFQLMENWPGPGNVWLDAGTVIDGSEARWSGVIFPLTFKCLDQEAYDQLVEWHSQVNDHFLHRLHYDAICVQPKRLSK